MITASMNIPLNNALANLAPTAQDRAQHWAAGEYAGLVEHGGDNLRSELRVHVSELAGPVVANGVVEAVVGQVEPEAFVNQQPVDVEQRAAGIVEQEEQRVFEYVNKARRPFIR